MDFSQHPYFAPNPQGYPFIGISPLTPSHSNSAPSEEYNHTSPPDVYSEFPPAEQPRFDAFDPYAAQFSHDSNQPAFPGPPTPPTNNPVPRQRQQLDVAHTAQQQQQTANHSNPESNPANQESLDDHARRGTSNSEDDEASMTPAQSRRKAQNRAAQRAFRERKERHVKDLEAKLANMEAEAQQTTTENERLKREMQKMSTENEILRATSVMAGSGHSISPEPRVTGPMQYSPTDFYSDLLAKHNNKAPSHRIVTSDDGERLLAAGATWDLIINHESFRKGLVDVGTISDMLKNQARCDGQGPVFAERSILEAIAASVASGSDELL